MGIFDKIKSTLNIKNESEIEFEKVVLNTLDEFKETGGYFYNLKVNNLNTYTQNVIIWQDKKKISFIVYLIKNISKYNNSDRYHNYDEQKNRINSVELAFVQQLFKAKLIVNDDDIAIIHNAVILNYNKDFAPFFSYWPYQSFFNQIQNQFKGKEISETLKTTLNSIKSDLEQPSNVYYNKDKLKLIEKIDSILFQSSNEINIVKPTLFLGEDDFSEFANKIIERLNETEKTIWYKLITKAQKASGSKPTNKYLDETKLLFKELGADKFKAIVNEWFQFVIKYKEIEKTSTTEYSGRIYTHTYYEFISAINIEAIKGFVWMCAHFHDNVTIHNIANLAERCFKKIPNIGPASAAIGNACLYTLYKSKGLDGIGQLSRLKLRIKQSSTQALIEKYLEEAAKEQGISIYEIEDLAVDDFDLKKGERIWEFDDYKAVFKITGIGKSEINWYKPDGSQQKTMPAFVKDKFSAKLKKLKDATKQIDQMTSAQRDRIDRMLRADRKINWNNFNELYLQHGLMCFIAEKIIWNFTENNTTNTAILINNEWTNNKNEIIKPSANTMVSLWHPATASVEEIKTWRDYLMQQQIQQPLKQAFREVYLLTAAEINTKSYSNRMAAHVLKQHQFNSLAKIRGWKYSLLGCFDNGMDNGTASLNLPEYALKAEFWINEINADDAYNDTGIWNFVATDQVRFVKKDSNDVVDLVDIPIIPFSEVMRDVDLFVGVASVGNDPSWQDNGGIPAYRDYWQTYSFGDLSELAKTRKGILENLLPRLKISKIAEIKDKFLVVKGKIRTYKIHIGSTNILMEPNDEYLCIVPDRSQKNYTENLFLPFEGDNGLSVVLSKAFLLMDDDKISDTTITSQIKRK
jgi:hypothetical protein